MRDALRAAKEADADAAAAALSKPPEAFARSLDLVTASFEADWLVVIQRIATAFGTRAQSAQEQLEDALLRKEAPDVLAQRLAAFTKASRAADSVRALAVRRGTGGQGAPTLSVPDDAPLRDAFSTLVRINAALASTEALVPEVDVSSFRYVSFRRWNPMRQLVAGLHDMVAAHNAELRAKDASFRTLPEPLATSSENDAPAKLAREMQQRQDEWSAVVRRRLEAVGDGTAAAALAEGLRPPLLQYQGGSEVYEWTLAMKTELLRLAGACESGEGDNGLWEAAQDPVHPFAADLHRLRLRLQRVWVARVLSAREFMEEAHTDPNPRLALLKYAAAKATEGAWEQVRKALALGHFPALTSQLRAIDTYLGARQLEAEGSVPAAIQSYKAVLSATGEFVPVKDTIERLKHLRLSP